MTMTPRQLFKFGFLLQCADEGLTPAETRERIDVCLTKMAEGGLGTGLVHLLRNFSALGIAGAGVTGALTGHLAARMTEPQADPDMAKQQELIAAYRQYADHARRNAARRGYRPAGAPASPRLFAA
jgi:hypothetical protein